MSNNTPVLRGTWNFPTTIWFGAGKIAMLSRACRHLGITRPLFVTDPTLSETEMVKTAIAQAEADGIAPILFSGIKPNPVGANIDAGVDALLAAGCDGVIALGGGSSLDAGKTIALAAAQPAGGIPFWNLEEGRDDWRRAIPPLKIVAIPTTAGTGSETGRSTVVVNESTRRKVIITHPGMMPGIVIADPELTLSLPADITAATGMDALVHCLEAYCSPFANPMCDGVALEGLRLIHESLSVAV
ncbi:MAG TPA: alcohol dehydrogenase, partial [Rhodospirillaceae bacterium]|nr:alcohol dehydrogenase [Rhodospirillaceae bacterium]